MISILAKELQISETTRFVSWISTFQAIWQFSHLGSWLFDFRISVYLNCFDLGHRIEGTGFRIVNVKIHMVCVLNILKILRHLTSWFLQTTKIWIFYFNLDIGSRIVFIKNIEIHTVCVLNSPKIPRFLTDFTSRFWFF